MRIDVEIERLMWDDWNREHIRKHGVTADEAAEAVVRRGIREDTYKGRQQLIGSTVAGRILSVIIGPVPDEPGSFYVFSARPASSTERRRYARSVEGDGP